MAARLRFDKPEVLARERSAERAVGHRTAMAGGTVGIAGRSHSIAGCGRLRFAVSLLRFAYSSRLTGRRGRALAHVSKGDYRRAILHGSRGAAARSLGQSAWIGGDINRFAIGDHGGVAKTGVSDWK